MAKGPASAQAVADHQRKVALRAPPLEDEDEPLPNEDDGVARGSANIREGPAHRFPHEDGIERARQVPVEAVRGTRSSSDTGGNGPRARSSIPIVAGRPFRVAGPAEGPASTHPAGPLFNRLARFRIGSGRGSCPWCPAGRDRSARIVAQAILPPDGSGSRRGAPTGRRIRATGMKSARAVSRSGIRAGSGRAAGPLPPTRRRPRPATHPPGSVDRAACSPTSPVTTVTSTPPRIAGAVRLTATARSPIINRD